MVKVIYDTSDDAQIREMVRIREKTMHDEASALGNARREGEQRGIAIGEQRGEKRGIAIMVEKLKASGMTDEQIKNILSAE